MTNLDSQVSPMSASLTETAESAQRAMKKLEEMLSNLEQSAAEERYELRTMLMELSKSNRAIRVLVDYLQRDPKSLVWGKK